MKRSEQTDLLAAALVAIQAEVPAIPKDSQNPFFKSKYAGLPAVVEKASPIAAKHGVAVSQAPDFDGEHDLLTTLVLHTSGQWVESSMRLHLSKLDPQGQGSAITYARRYAYMAALGLVADEDDDANAASRPSKPRAKPAAPPVEADPLLSAAEAKRRLLEAFDGDKGKAVEVWGTRGSDPIMPGDLARLVSRHSSARPAPVVDDPGRPFDE